MLPDNSHPVALSFPPPTNQTVQSYVVNKLLRYLKWSNLVRRHFRISDQDPAGLREEPSSDSTNDLTDSEESCSSDREKTSCPDALTAPGLRGSLANGNGHGRPGGQNGRASNGDSKGGTPGGGRHTDGYTFSDRGA